MNEVEKSLERTSGVNEFKWIFIILIAISAIYARFPMLRLQATHDFYCTALAKLQYVAQVHMLYSPNITSTACRSDGAR